MNYTNFAAEILRNEAWPHVYSVLETRLVEQWKNSPVDNWKLRERIYDQLQALRDVRQQLESIIAEGQFARKP